MEQREELLADGRSGEVAAIAENGARRSPGRPSVTAPFAFVIGRWLNARPETSGAEVLRRARRVGYRGGKSALYALVARLRAAAISSTTQSVDA